MALVLTYTKVLKNGETLELYHGGNTHRTLWVDKSSGGKPKMLDYKDHKTYVAALGHFERTK